MEFAAARHSMVENQVRAVRVTDPLVVNAMDTVPREQFAPKALQSVAYVDRDLPIGDGRVLLEPMVFARLLQMASIQRDEAVLDIGCGTGYSSAVIGEIAASVVALENDEDLVAQATSILSGQEVDNVAVVKGDLASGAASQGPFDVIVLNGSVPAVPPELLEQLSEGGRLVAVVGAPGAMGTATLFTRQGDSFGSHGEFEVVISALPGFEQQSGFVF